MTPPIILVLVPAPWIVLWHYCELSFRAQSMHILPSLGRSIPSPTWPIMLMFPGVLFETVIRLLTYCLLAINGPAIPYWSQDFASPVSALPGDPWQALPVGAARRDWEAGGGEGNCFFWFYFSASLLNNAVYFQFSPFQDLPEIHLLHSAVVVPFSSSSLPLFLYFCWGRKNCTWPLNAKPLMYTHVLPAIQANINLGAAVKSFCKCNWDFKSCYP